jgi:hypothetical protein
MVGQVSNADGLSILNSMRTKRCAAFQSLTTANRSTQHGGLWFFGAMPRLSLEQRTKQCKGEKEAVRSKKYPNDVVRANNLLRRLDHGSQLAITVKINLTQPLSELMITSNGTKIFDIIPSTIIYNVFHSHFEIKKLNAKHQTCFVLSQFRCE